MNRMQVEPHAITCGWISRNERRAIISLAAITTLLVAALVQQVRSQVSHQPVREQPGSRLANHTYQNTPYQTIFYHNRDLKIEAYYYKPEGNGPFPLVIYNHGSRAGAERREVPFLYVANVLRNNGYAVLVPERRGYGLSDGPTFTEEVGNDVSDRMMRRFHEEASDVLAGLDFLKHGNSGRSDADQIDFRHVAIMGWSHGGIISLVTAGERHDFVALIDQAGGALTWNRSPTLQRELPEVARKIKIPALCMDAQNDATTNAVREVGDAVKASGEWEKTIIYPPFTPATNPANIAPGHLIFGIAGISLWQNDMLSFLSEHVRSGH